MLNLIICIGLQTVNLVIGCFEMLLLSLADDLILFGSHNCGHSWNFGDIWGLVLFMWIRFSHSRCICPCQAFGEGWDVLDGFVYLFNFLVTCYPKVSKRITIKKIYIQIHSNKGKRRGFETYSPIVPFCVLLFMLLSF